MKCNQAYDQINEWVDGTLAEAEAFKQHVSGCERCGVELRAQESLIRALNTSPLDAPPKGFVDRIIGKLRASGHILTAPAPAHVDWRWPIRIPLAAALLIVIAVALMPSTIEPLMSGLATGAVAVTDIWVAVQDKIANANLLDKAMTNIERNVGTLATVARAGFSLLASVGEMFMLPALAALLTLALGVLWYFRAAHRRGPHSSSFSF